MRCLALVAALLCGSCQYIPGTKANLERTALEKLEPLLVDTTGAKFRTLHKVTVKGETIICGEVNSRNRMGGYAGFTRFMAGTNTDFVVVDPKAGKYSPDDEASYQAGFDSVWPSCESGRPA